MCPILLNNCRVALELNNLKRISSDKELFSFIMISKGIVKQSFYVQVVGASSCGHVAGHLCYT